jgi:NAD(P)-dependent dehydrogenase (short-subunit alcohol dehydrogenase family)
MLKIEEQEMPDLLDLAGQAALVTGAGQGAGRGIARMLAAHNAAVAVNDYVIERAEAVAAEIREAGGKATAVQADVGDRASVIAAFGKARAALGPLTILVNNAGNAGPNGSFGMLPFWETDPAEWPRFLQTNLLGVMNCCHVALPDMIAAKRGRIVTIGSDSGRVGDARLAAYGAAKAGAAGFMRCLASETGRYGVTCNIISLATQEPQGMSAEDLAEHYANERVKAQLSRYTIRRFGRPDDVAVMALFLCSDAASWITGQTYPVNGGYSYTL